MMRLCRCGSPSLTTNPECILVTQQAKCRSGAFPFAAGTAVSSMGPGLEPAVDNCDTRDAAARVRSQPQSYAAGGAGGLAVTNDCGSAAKRCLSCRNTAADAAIRWDFETFIVRGSCPYDGWTAVLFSE